MDSTTVTLGPVRFSYLACLAPSSIDGSELKYRVTPLIPKKDKKTIAAVRAGIAAAMQIGVEKGMWKGDKLPPNFKGCLRDGDAELETDTTKGKGEEYAGMMFFNANADVKHKPGVVNAKRQVIIDEDEIYSGAYGYVNVTFFPFTNKSIGIGASFNNIMKTKDGEKFASRVSVDSAFEGIAVEEDDDDLL